MLILISRDFQSKQSFFSIIYYFDKKKKLSEIIIDFYLL